MVRAITRCALTLSGACLFLFSHVPTYGQTSSRASAGHTQAVGDDKDPIAIVELGAAMSWNLTGGAATFAPNLAAEVTPIEHWLELEGLGDRGREKCTPYSK